MKNNWSFNFSSQDLKLNACTFKKVEQKGQVFKEDVAYKLENPIVDLIIKLIRRILKKILPTSPFVETIKNSQNDNLK